MTTQMLRFGPLLLFAASCSGSCESSSTTPPAPPLAGVTLSPAFPGLAFDRPVFLTAAPGVADRVFVVEQGGVISTFDPSAPEPEAKVFLDLSAKVSRAGNEEGLLGLAFHPQYGDTGRFFVHYSAASAMRSVVSELTVSSDRDRADPASERTVLTQDQPYRNHNGGTIAFGPDGFLYIGFGDGGSGGDPHGNGQNLGTWLGKILRIDVDNPSGEQSWSVPGDNPFVGDGLARPEIWALGLRNPWRFSFDRATGALWLGDVGQDRYEEVDIVGRGDNLGWRSYEGYETFEDEPLGVGAHVQPVAVYGRNEGESITGGYVYRGSSFPLLQGVYVFADFQSGRIWGLFPSDGGWERRLLVESGKNIASFGEDADGELYVCAFDGQLHRLEPTVTEPPNLVPLPSLLSQTGVFSDVVALEPAASALEYTVNAPLWSDGADKARVMQVPDGAAIELSLEGAWQFPDGTTFAKTFQGGIGARRLETRIIRRQQGHWQAASYVWNEAQTEAELAPEGASIDYETEAGPATWSVPSSDDCRSCHTAAAGFVLGVETAQVNTGGQIADWVARGVLSGAPADLETLPALARPDDEDADLEARARAYLHANCAQCHRPQGPGNALIDLRWTTPLAETRTVGEAPAQGDLGVAGALLVAPGDPDRSTLVLRAATRELGAMPPLASDQVDEAGVQLLREWVTSLPQ
jgi:uncharacterized repeat protein (TIGR03806 family)